MRVRLFMAATAALCSASLAHAGSLTYDFNYSGSSTYSIPGISASGAGSFTVTYNPGQTTGTLTAFTFTDTVDGDALTYGLSNVLSSKINLTTGSSPAIATASITTDYLLGSKHGDGIVDFILHDSAGTIADSTEGLSLDTITSGTGSVSSAALAVAPEPSSIALVGTGLLGVAAVLRKRLLA